jgi:PAS domain S-box-containing protein
MEASAAAEPRAAEPESLVSPQELLRLRLALEASGEVIFMTDAAGTITYVNPEFVRLYGYDPSEVVGRTTPRILKSGATTDEEYEGLWRELSHKRVVRREFVNRTKAGALVLVESSANPIFIDDELVGFLAVQRDITARKATEAALRDSEARYRTLAEAAHDSIFIVDRIGRIEYANAASGEQFGVRSEDQIGRVLHDVFPPATANALWRELSTVFATGERHYYETRFETPQGELWLGTWLVPMSQVGSEPTAVMGVAREITDRKRLEREFAQAQKMEAIGRLAGGIAHDFNNLLTAILGYSELLLDRVADESAFTQDVDEIRKAAERASRLTRQLLAFSRKQPIAARILDLNEVVADLEKMLTRVIGEDVRFEITVGTNLGRVKADPGQIEQLLMNLVINARDAMPKGGRICLKTANADLDAEFVRKHDGAVAGRYVRIVVEDSGCGMTPEVLAHVFEPFFTTKPAGKGTGLGLATVYGIVKQSGGYITIDSAPSAGTKVTTFLPRVDAPAVANTTMGTPSERALNGTETILVAEDQPGVRALIRRVLELYGYTVLMSDNVMGTISIAECHNGAIDLLLSDVIMPDMSGPDLAQRVVRIRPAIRVLYVSGFTTHPAVGIGASSPKAAFLSKPFTPQALAMKVRECLDRRDETIVVR